MKSLKKYSIFSLLFAGILSFALCFAVSAPKKANAATNYFKNVSVSLTDSTVLKYTVELPEGYTSAKMTYTYGFGEGATEETGVVSADKKTASFAFDKISPENYAEKVTAKLTLEGDGKSALTNSYDYSIADYVRDLLDKNVYELKLSAEKYSALRKLAVDMLYLGDEAQDFVAGETPVAQYATSGLTEQEKALRSVKTAIQKPENYKTLAELNTKDSKVFYISRGAEFTSKISVKFTFAVKGEVGTITVKANDENVAVTPVSLTVGENEVKGYSVIYDKIFAELYGKNITFKVYGDGVEISSFEYGLAHFNYALSTDEKAKNIAAEAYVYGVSAAEYKNAKEYDFIKATRDCVTSGTTKDYYYYPETGKYFEEIGGAAVTPEVDIAHHEKTIDNAWHTCEVCGKEYLATRNGGGSQNSGRKKFVLLPGKDPFVAESYVEVGTESDYTTTFNLKTAQFVTYEFTLPESDVSVVKVSVNMRNTNLNVGGEKNLEYQLKKTLHLYVGSVSSENEVPVSDSAVLKPQLENYNLYFNYEIATVAIPENNKIILKFVHPGETDGDGKARGGYLCYLHVEKSNEGCTEGYHKTKRHEAIAATCTVDGNEQYFECLTCGKLFRDLRATDVLQAIPTIAATGVHVWDIPRYSDASSHTLTCLSCGKVENEAHEHNEGETHLIVAKAPNKVWYTVGETLDTDRMELYISTVCAKGCKCSAKVKANEYTIEYTNGSAFALGDTYVTLKHTASGATAKLPVYVTEVGKTITIDDKDNDYVLSGSASDKSRNNDTGGIGQSGYGGSYSSSIRKTGAKATIKFNLDTETTGRIVIQACSDRTVTGNNNQGFPEYSKGMCVNDVMVVIVNGKRVEISYDAVLKGSVSNLEASTNRWVWTNWTSVDLGKLNLKAGENIVTVEFTAAKGYTDSYAQAVVGQLDCINVFLD